MAKTPKKKKPKKPQVETQDTNLKVNELWKPIVGFNGYSVSNLGRIKNKKGLIMALQMDMKGYHRVGLFKEGKNHIKKVHRIVSIAFISNPNNLPQVNHKNGIKTDNRVENLEWCDNSYNVKHAFSIGLQNNIGSNHPRTKLTEEQVIEIRETKLIPLLVTQRQLSLKYGVSLSAIKDIRQKRNWTHI